MMNSGYTLFETPIGRCAVAWSPVGIVAVQLPERHDTATVARLRCRNPGVERREAPVAVRRAIAAIQRLLDGAGTELSGIDLDLSGSARFSGACTRRRAPYLRAGR